MLEIKGKVNTAICYAKVIEEDAIEQIRTMCDYELTKDSKIRIMPDVHAGAGCTIGTTMTVIDKACPNVVGVDIGSQTHYARAFDNRGRELTKRVFSFQNDIEGFNSFQLWTEKLKMRIKRLQF